MSLPKDAVQQLQKLVQENVNKYFGPLKPAEKTPDKVKFFAQKQLDFFINGLVKRGMPELRDEMDERPSLPCAPKDVERGQQV